MGVLATPKAPTHFHRLAHPLVVLRSPPLGKVTTGGPGLLGDASPSPPPLRPFLLFLFSSPASTFPFLSGPLGFAFASGWSLSGF